VERSNGFSIRHKGTLQGILHGKNSKSYCLAKETTRRQNKKKKNWVQNVGQQAHA
jgi:hypothetical protein